MECKTMVELYLQQIKVQFADLMSSWNEVKVNIYFMHFD